MLESFSVIFISIVFEAVPFVLFGTLVSSLIEEYISQEWILNRIGNDKFRFYFLAGLMGLIMPVCECAIVPIMRRLVKKGIPVGIGVTFMLATPIVNPVVLLSTSYAFGGKGLYVVSRGVGGYIAAIIIGLIIQKTVSGKDILNDKEYITSSCGHDHSHNHIHTSFPWQTEFTVINHVHSSDCGHDHGGHSDSRVVRIVGHLCSEFLEVGRFLLFGAAIAAAMQTIVPRKLIMGISSDPISSVLVMMLLAFLLSLCSEADAFIASTFRQAFPNHAIIAFLVYGPMIDVKNTLMLLDGFKGSFVIRLVAVTTLICFIMSMLMMLIL